MQQCDLHIIKTHNLDKTNMYFNNLILYVYEELDL